ncbi:MAG: SRPBCC family protein [Dehalococcoidales bacterium]|nr:MAG: SRPBCC family protein [Dehalococcoidales bacterium]
MVTLVDSIEINTTPEQVFNCLTNLRSAKDYREWHPDHTEWKWIEGEPFQEGSVVFCEEYLHGELHRLKFMCTNTVTNELIEYKPLFPWSLIMLSSSFAIEPESEGVSIFRATIRFRGLPFIEKVFKSQFGAIRLHMKEEGENLKKILEG